MPESEAEKLERVWPCLPLSPDITEKQHEEMKKRDVPVRLSPEEWDRAHSKATQALQDHAVQGSYYAFLDDLDHVSDYDNADGNQILVTESMYGAPVVAKLESLSSNREPEVICEQSNNDAAGEVSWSVKVVKKKQKAKMSSNQRRAAARKPKSTAQPLVAMITEDGARAVCMAVQ